MILTQHGLSIKRIGQKHTTKTYNKKQNRQSFDKLRTMKIESKMLRQHFVKKGTLHLKKSNKTYDITFVNHHFSHAWYAAAASGFKPVLIMTADGGLGPTFQGGGKEEDFTSMINK